jgi:hypothetical protein
VAASAAAAASVVPQLLPDMAAAAVGYDMSDQLYAGSQAQSDSLVMIGVSGTDSDSQVRGGVARLHCWLWQRAQLCACTASCVVQGRGTAVQYAVPALICCHLLGLPAHPYMQEAAFIA